MLTPGSRPSDSQRGLRILAGASVLMAGTGLYFLGAQPFAVGLFPAPWDKLAHVASFTLIGAASGVASGRRGWSMALSCLAGALMIGIMDELHQAWLPGRSASWMDLGADAVGGSIGAALLGASHALLDRKAGQPPRHR